MSGHKTNKINYRVTLCTGNRCQRDRDLKVVHVHIG
jgi:hypothetical protein